MSNNLYALSYSIITSQLFLLIYLHLRLSYHHIEFFRAQDFYRMILRSRTAIILTMIMLSDAYDPTIERVKNGAITNLDSNIATTESSALMKLIHHIQNEIEKLKEQETPSDYQDYFPSQDNSVFSRVNKF